MSPPPSPGNFVTYVLAPPFSIAIGVFSVSQAACSPLAYTGEIPGSFGSFDALLRTFTI